MNITQYLPKPSVIIGLLFVLPGAIMLSLLMLSIEPPLGPLAPYLQAPAEGPHVVGSLIALTFILFLPMAGLLINLAKVRQTVISGGRWLSNPTHLVVTAMALALIATFAVGIIVDQYPCWIGVPNCD